MRVLLIGAGGAVGRRAAACLHRDGHRLMLASRRPADAGRGPGPDRVELDLAAVLRPGSPAPLPASDVVVNCAGPSSRWTAPLARTALVSGAHYVDPGGDAGTAAVLNAAAIHHRRTVILGAGVQPGLAAIALRAVLHRGGPAVGARIACGGLQPLTASSVEDYLAAVRTSLEFSGRRLRSGRVERVSPVQAGPAPGGFPPSATPHLYLDPEGLDVAREAGLPDLTWFNITDAPRGAAVLARLMAGAGRPEEALEAMAADLAGRRPYFRIDAETTGPDGEQTLLSIGTADSYALTGEMVAAAVGLVADEPAGARLASRAGQDDLRWLARAAAVAEVDWSMAGAL